MLFESCSDPRSRQFETALGMAIGHAEGASYIGILPRRRPGSTKKDVTVQGNVCWVDIDTPDALSLIDEVLVPLGLRPTLVLSSGHGFWFFWKIDRLLSCSAIETRNRVLAELLGGDSCFDRTRLCRVPGSINRKGGGKAPVAAVFVDETLVYSPAALLRVRHCKKRSASNRTTKTHRATDPSGITPKPDDRAPGRVWIEPNWASRPDLERYINGNRSVADRSRIESQICSVLISNGWTRAQVHQFFDEYQLPRYVEDEERGRGDYLDRLISKAIYFWAPEWNPQSLPPCDPPVYKEPSQTRMNAGNQRSLSERRFGVLCLADGQGRKAFIDLVSEEAGVTKGTAEHDIKALVKSSALRKEIDPGDPCKRRIRYFANEQVVDLGRRLGTGHLRMRSYLLPHHTGPLPYRFPSKEEGP